MNFNNLYKFVKNMSKEYGVPCYDISIHYNCNNVFYTKHGYADFKNRIKTLGKNLYFMHPSAKIMCCVALMRLAEDGKVSLDDSVKNYLPHFEKDVSIKEMIHEYSKSFDYGEKVFNFLNMSKLIEEVSEQSFHEYINDLIIKPLKMKSTSFELNNKNKNHISLQYNFDKTTKRFKTIGVTVEELFEKYKGCLITTANDFSKLCNVLCSGGTTKKGYNLLSEESINTLINEILYKETEKKDVFICLGYNGDFVLIDTQRKVTIVYAQHVKNIPVEQLKMYPKMRELVYEGIDSASYNLFP